jgi:hypothetical protein
MLVAGPPLALVQSGRREQPRWQLNISNVITPIRVQHWFVGSGAKHHGHVKAPELRNSWRETMLCELQLNRI